MSEPADNEPVEGMPDEIEMGGLVLRPGDFVDMFRYERPVGKGGMAFVLLARDPGGQPVALKVLKASRMRTGLARFRREFRALSRLDHPNIIRVESWGDIHGHPYLAMEYVDGVDLHLAIRRMSRRPGDVRWPWVEDVLIQLARALGHLSRRGLVHRDLKPSNVLITRDGVCKLTDFGIVKDLDPDRDPVVSTTLVGTWAYASPEQIAGDPIDHRSDLYSLGVILYAMLTGRRPFAAENMSGYLELHRSKRPTPPSHLVPDVPPALEQICLRLLEKSPQDRFQSASEILEALLADEPETAPEGDPGATGWTPPLVGRQEALAAGSEALARLTRSEGGVLLFEGAEGSGRSRVLGAVVADARRRGLPVHEARITASEGAFEALLRVSQQIGQELGGQVPPELARAIARFALGRGRMPGDARYQLYDGVRSALQSLLARGPQVLALDDLHLAPAPFLDLLNYLVRTLAAREGQPLLVLGAGRAELPRPDGPPPEAGTYAAFRLGRDLGLHPRIQPLPPLRRADVAELLVAVMGEEVGLKALVDLLHRQSGGDPLFVVEFVRGLMQRGVLVPRQGGGWRLAVDPAELSGDRLALPPGLRQAIRERLAPQGDDVRAVLEVCAVAGRELDLEVLLDVVELLAEEESRAHGEDDPTEVEAEVAAAPAPPPRRSAPVVVRHGPDRWMDALDQAIDAGLLEERRGALGSRVDFAQRQVAEVVAADLPSEARARLHRRLAAALELRYADSPVAAEAIGEHYRQAGDAPRAFSYLVQAAVGLHERALLTEAGALVRRARALQSAAGAGGGGGELAASALALDQVEAALWFNQGAWDDAARALDALRRRALALGRPGDAGEAAVQYGITLRRLDRATEGEEVIRSVLVDARQRHDRRLELRALHALAGAAWARGDLEGCERLASQGLVGTTDPEMAEGRAGILLALTAVQASKGQLAAAVAGLSEAEELLRGLREKKTRASVLCNLSEVLHWKGELVAAEARGAEALSLARDLVYRVVEVSALRCRAMARLDLGELGPARLDLEHGLAIARELGMAEEEVPIRFHLARVALKEEDPATAEVHLVAARAAAGRADPESFGPSVAALLARALAQQGFRDEARLVLASAAGACTRRAARSCCSCWPSPGTPCATTRPPCRWCDRHARWPRASASGPGPCTPGPCSRTSPWTKPRPGAPARRGPPSPAG
ncbi:protein kinase [Myxococcota bacterium]|nr:protein kinase [Myxococcota bacterium]